MKAQYSCGTTLLTLIAVCVLPSAAAGESFLVTVKTATLTEVRQSVRDGADVNDRDAFGCTALMTAAAFNPDPAVVLWLVECGAELSSVDLRGDTVLMYSLQNPNPMLPATLLRAGSLVNVPGGSGVTVLMVALRDNRDRQTVVALVEAGANVNARDFRGRTALMHAARYSKYPDPILFSARAGAHLDVTGPEGRTALIWAVIDNACTEVISALLRAGADPRIVDASEKTALDYAQSVDRLGGQRLSKILRTPFRRDAPEAPRSVDSAPCQAFKRLKCIHCDMLAGLREYCVRDGRTNLHVKFRRKREVSMEIVCIFSSDDEGKIEWIKTQLEENGIPTIVKNLYTQNLFSGIKLFTGHDPIAGSIQIYVREDELQIGLEILKEKGCEHCRRGTQWAL